MNKLADPKFDFSSSRCLMILEGLRVRTKSEQTSILKMAREQYVNEKNRLAGKMRVNWKLVSNEKLIKDKCDDQRNTNTLVFAVSSGMTNKFDNELIDHILLNPNKPYITIVVFHPSDDSEKAWNTREGNRIYNRFMDLFEHMVVPQVDGIPVERTLNFVVMDSWKSDKTLAK